MRTEQKMAVVMIMIKDDTRRLSACNKEAFRECSAGRNACGMQINSTRVVIIISGQNTDGGGRGSEEGGGA